MAFVEKIPYNPDNDKTMRLLWSAVEGLESRPHSKAMWATAGHKEYDYFKKGNLLKRAQEKTRTVTVSGEAGIDTAEEQNRLEDMLVRGPFGKCGAIDDAPKVKKPKPTPQAIELDSDTQTRKNLLKEAQKTCAAGNKGKVECVQTESSP